MKKLLMSVFCMALCSLNVISADDDLNPAQLQLRNEIKQFIAEEGFMPEIDSDGDIHFKKEGDNYYITVSANDEAPMYVVLSRPFNNPEGYSPEAIKIAASELNLYKGVKVLCWDTSFSIRGEMFLVSSEAFKYSFYKIMSQLENIENDFMSELEKVGPSAGSGSTSSSFGGIYVPGLITDIQIANVKQ